MPTFSKHQGKTCVGVQLLVTDPVRYQAVPTAVAMLLEARKYDGFAWREDSDFERPFWIDKLSGSSQLREMLDAGRSLEEITGTWRSQVSDFERTRHKYLLYR